MSDDQFPASGNWWESARNVRFESGESQSISSSSGLTNIGNFGWQQHDTVQQDMKPRSNSSMDNSVSGSSSLVFHDTHHQKQLQPHDSATSSNDPNLHMMGLGLSSQAMDWNQASLLRGEKGSEGSFRSMLQENLSSSSPNFQHETGNNNIGLSPHHVQVHWRPEKLFSPESSTNEFKRGFSLDQTQFSPQYSSGDSTVTSQGLPCTFQMDYVGNPSSILQGLLGSESNNNQPQQGGAASFESRTMNFPYSSAASYGLGSNIELVPSWSKVPQFLRASPPKQPPNNQLHFTNNAPFWNANSEAAIKDARSSFIPSLQPPFSTSNFDVQSKNISDVRDSGAVVKKSGGEPAPKRPRNETPSPLPAFKVRKEKMGDRITALQQLVSPFGKTDTASVLSEAIEYIKFLHEQVTVLSTPYMKSGAPIQHQQSSGKSKECEGPKQDLRSRGLCLVPVSSTFPVTHEPTVEYWTPTFGGTYR
ncbi:transcription factor bHLH123-like [Abrus precatorius]|uniref:Transcription factor bHLH123-like n=1 Tax=Abrus precatorius TaxID=3816 RepID=A0A8B8LKM8_ABRPR|nr:transcription factor bHLH123-like [Abrus precatorius]